MVGNSATSHEGPTMSRTSHAIRGSVTLAIVAAMSACFLFPKRPLPPPVRSPWEDWIMFDQPESKMSLGWAWDLSGAPDAGCYGMSDSVSDSRSWTLFDLQWADTSNLGLRLSVDSLVIKKAVSPGPLGRCIISRNGLPGRPGVIALIGAHSFTYKLNTSSGTSIDANGELRAHEDSASVSFKDAHSRGTSATFSSFRWIGAQFLGLDPPSSIPDTEFTPDFAVGSPFRLKWGFEITAVPERDRIRVRIRNTTPPYARDSALVAEGDLFPIMSPPHDIVRGEYFTGRIWYDAMRMHVRVRAERGAFVELRWERREQRDSMLAWTKPKRRG